MNEELKKLPAIIKIRNSIIENAKKSANDKEPLKGMKQLTYDIIEAAYSGGSMVYYPVQADIVKLVREFRGLDSDPNWVDSEKYLADKPYLAFNSCQPSISKHLEALVGEKKIIQLENNTYIPYTLEVAREEIRKKIINLISFNRGSIYVLGSSKEEAIYDNNDDTNKKDDSNVYEKDNNSVNKKSKKRVIVDYQYATCSILIDVRYDYIGQAKELLKQYIGIANCYDISEFQGKILLMIEGKNSEVMDLRKGIRAIVEEGYKKEKK